jgi:hypothetical protein
VALGPHRTSFSVGIGFLSPELKQPKYEVDHLQPRLRMSEAILYSFRMFSYRAEGQLLL